MGQAPNTNTNNMISNSNMEVIICVGTKIKESGYPFQN